MRADRRDKLLKWIDTGGQNCTPNNSETLPAIGELLGHSDIETTTRYAHLARGSLHKAADRIADSIATDVL